MSEEFRLRLTQDDVYERLCEICERVGSIPNDAKRAARIVGKGCTAEMAERELLKFTPSSTFRKRLVIPETIAMLRRRSHEPDTADKKQNRSRASGQRKEYEEVHKKKTRDDRAVLAKLVDKLRERGQSKKMTDEEAQVYLRLSSSELENLRKRRKIAYYKVSGKVFYLQSDLDAFFNKCRIAPRDEG